MAEAHLVAVDSDTDADPDCDDAELRLRCRVHAGWCITLAKRTPVPDSQWYRVRVRKSGYESTVFYRYHQLGGQCMTFSDINCSELRPFPCDTQNFALWRHGGPGPTPTPHEALPDLMIDFRELETQVYRCVNMPDPGPGQPWRNLEVMRFGTSSPNAGKGDFFVEERLVAPAPGATPTPKVYQRLFKADRSISREVEIPGAAFEYHAAHSHIHLNDWAQMRLVRRTPACALPNRTPTPCIAKSGQKRSFCIRDEADFDYGIGAERRYRDCDSKQQGISSGMRDLYPQGLAGQFLDLQGVVGGTYWLEAEVDPDRRFVERERENNIARVEVTIPATRCTAGPGGSWTCAPGIANCEAIDCRLCPPDCCEWLSCEVPGCSSASCDKCKDYYCYLDPGPDKPACLGRTETCPCE